MRRRPPPTSPAAVSRRRAWTPRQTQTPPPPPSPPRWSPTREARRARRRPNRHRGRAEATRRPKRLTTRFPLALPLFPLLPHPFLLQLPLPAPPAVLRHRSPIHSVRRSHVPRLSSPHPPRPASRRRTPPSHACTRRTPGGGRGAPRGGARRVAPRASRGPAPLPGPGFPAPRCARAPRDRLPSTRRPSRRARAAAGAPTRRTPRTEPRDQRRRRDPRLRRAPGAGRHRADGPRGGSRRPVVVVLFLVILGGCPRGASAPASAPAPASAAPVPVCRAPLLLEPRAREILGGALHDGGRAECRGN